MSTDELNSANDGQSRAGEAGANLTVGLGSEPKRIVKTCNRCGNNRL